MRVFLQLMLTALVLLTSVGGAAGAACARGVGVAAGDLVQRGQPIAVDDCCCPHPEHADSQSTARAACECPAVTAYAVFVESLGTAPPTWSLYPATQVHNSVIAPTLLVTQSPSVSNQAQRRPPRPSYLRHCTWLI